MVSALVSGSSGPGSSPGRGHCVVVMRKLSFHRHFLVIWKIIEKPTVTTFQLTTRNLNILICTLPTLCTPVRVQHRLSFSRQIVGYRFI